MAINIRIGSAVCWYNFKAISFPYKITSQRAGPVGDAPSREDR